jgi:tetratricopeptide (TPR) repeat protein
LFCLDRIGEAEQQWLKAVKLCPAYLEAAEHLVGLLYRKRSKKAIEVITFVQQSLRLSPSQMPQGASSASIDDISLARDAATKISDDTFSINTFGGRTRRSVAGAIPEAQGFGSSGYALPGSENARILALVHAKGTMLYSLKEIDQASEAFEEAVLISVGRRINGIHDLVRRIQIVLSPVDSVTGPRRQLLQQPSQPLLLPPERARQTAYLAFGGNGELPGLLYVAEGVPKRAATQTTSNSLLSLAKIFQDAMSGGTTGPKLLQRSSGVSDILSLYYLSLSLQESPSTANNVGILLAGVQQGTPQNLSSNIKHHHLSQPALPGVQAGSGLALALAYYQYGLRLDPKHVHLHTNLGSLLKDIGQLDLAIQMYEQAVSCDGNFDIALTNLANAVKDRGRVNDAIMYYKRAVRANPDFAEAVCGLFTALNSVCDWKGRGGVMLYSGKYDRWHVGEDGMLLDGRNHEHGSGLTKKVVDIVTRQLGEASQWGCNTLKDDVIHVFAQQLSDICEATVEDLEYRLRAWRRKPWEGSRVLRLVERATRVTLWKWYHDKHTTRKRTNTRYIRPRLPLSLTVPSAPTVLPFHTFTCPLRPNYIRSISQRNANRISCSTLRSPWLPATVYPPPSPPSPHLNIGYVSSDFNNHPLAHL